MMVKKLLVLLTVLWCSLVSAQPICLVLFEKDPVFLDFEASSLENGFPTEVAWSINGQIESFLIEPKPEWLKSYTWNAMAESLTKITLDDLFAQGVPVAKVIKAMERDGLFEKTVYATHSEKDNEWMGVLLAESNRKIELEHIEEKIFQQADRLGAERELARESYFKTSIELENSSLNKHRAGSDVQIMLSSYANFMASLFSFASNP